MPGTPQEPDARQQPGASSRPAGPTRDQRPVTHGDVAKGAGTALLSRLGAVIEVISQPAYTWMFGLATYGLYTVLWSLVNLVENVADLGMTSALQRVVPQTRNEGEAAAALRAALLIGVMPCIVIALAASLAAPWLATIINVAAADRPELATGIGLFAWALPLWAMVEISTSALRARRAFGPEIRLRIFWEQVIRLAIAAALWAMGVDTLGLLIAHLCSLTLTTLLSIRLLSRYYDLKLMLSEPFSSTTLTQTWLAGISVLPSNIVSRIFGDAPPVVLNLWFPGAAGATAAGLYGIARKLSSLVQMVRIAFSYVVGPLASAVARDDRGAIQPLYGFATRLSTVLALPISAVLIGGGWAILHLFGPRGHEALWLVIPLVAARAMEAIGGPAAAIQQVTSKMQHPVINSAVGLGCAIVSAAILLPFAAAMGMAIAVGTGLVASSLFCILQLRRGQGLNPFAPPFGRALATGLCVSMGIILLLLALRPLLPWPAEIALAVFCLFGGTWLSARLGLTGEDKAALGRTRQKLRL